MADAPTTASSVARDSAFEQQLREMNEALLLSSIHQHELREQAQNAEAALRLSETRYRRLFEAAQDGVILLNPDTRKIIDANPFVTALLGYTRDQLVGLELYEIGFFVDAQASRDMFETLKAARQFRYDSLPLQNHNGNARDVEVVANLHDENGHSVIQCNVRDITERKRSEKALRQSHDTYLSLIENNPFGINLIDADFSIAQVSPSAKSAFGDVAPLIGRDFGEILKILWQEPTAGEITTHFRHTLETGEGYHSRNFTGKRADRDADESYEWQIERVSLPGGRFGVVCYFYDLTERKRQEQHIELLMGEVNHRAKNLLAVVQAIARQTARSGDPSTFAIHLTERIRGLAASQDLLVKNKWTHIAMSELVHTQLSHFNDLVGTRVLLYGPPISLSPSAAQGIGMALHELATNAVKYGALSNECGRVHINWGHVAAVKPGFTLQWVEEGGPEVVPPTRKGFGNTVIGRMVEASVGGNVEMEYRKSGLYWKLMAPYSIISAG